ncbi:MULTISPECIES: PAS domain-containing hybrid sensor histidine kinase/response regulator [Sphingomonas]|uniref:PAS domain-containing hybrid sensor histidine kinase/response regulator n=1 Tax=Sphingomonas TaxID=13687 RepID=UPI000DEF0D0D|nr:MULTISPECIES: PAS domain-containing hybrid sensor histidine kinase/response regulator [Sphingomonas]
MPYPLVRRSLIPAAVAAVVACAALALVVAPATERPEVAIGIAVVALVLGAREWLARRSLRTRLDRSEQRFRDIAEVSPTGILMFTGAGRLFFANRRWAELTGVNLALDSGREWLACFPGVERPGLVQEWRRVSVSKRRFEGALGYIRADGSEGSCNLTITPGLDPRGRVTHLIVRVHDQTARWRAEAALVEREKLYRLLAEHGSDLVLRLSSDGEVRFASHAAQRLLATDPDELVGQPLLAVVHPDDWTTLHHALDPAAPLDPAPITFRVGGARQGFRWVEAGFNRVGENGEWVGSLRDIAQRRAAEQSRAEAERKLRETNRLLTLAEGLANVGHWHAAADSGEVLFSSEAQLLLRTMSTRCSFTAALGLVHADDRRRLLRILARSVREAGMSECQLRLATVAGETPRTVLVRLQAERRIGGGLVATFGVVTDVTDKLAAEARLFSTLDEARSAAQAKSSFLATMSHEIRTPMTGVLGMIELLRGATSASEREAYLDTLQQSADLLMTVLNDILDFSRLEGGHLDLAVQPFDLREAAAATVQLFERTADAKGLTLAFDWRAGETTKVSGDRVRIQQVLSNLVSNAIKFTDRGKVEVTISARGGRGGARRWCLAVSDTGIGIDVDDQARLFEPFVQGEGGARRRFGGTGLGLAISRRLAAGMGGHLKLRSTFGKGTTFVLKLPLPDVGVETTATVPPAPPPVLAKSRRSRPLEVLLAEDNRVNQLLILALLRRMGHRVTCYGDGAAAVAAAGARPFDVILMDMQMPLLDGLAAARTIRRSGGPNATTPIAAVTADASPDRRIQYAIEEIDCFLAKPIDTAALHALFAELTERRQARAQTRPGVVHFDRSRLDELRAALGHDRIAQLLSLFAQQLAAQPLAIREAIGRSDLAAAAAEAHSLKGAAMSIGGCAVGEAAAALEQALGCTTRRQADQLHEALRNLDRAVASTIAALPHELAAEAAHAA